VVSRQREAIEAIPRTRHRPRTCTLLASASLLAALALIAGPASPALSSPVDDPAATQAPSPSEAALPAEAPLPTPSNTPAQPAQPASPAITSPNAGAVVGDAIAFAGTAEPGSGIDLFVSASGQPICSVTTDAAGSWSCRTTILSAESVSVRAVQSVQGDTRETSIDVSVLNAPAAGAGGGGAISTGTVMGTGLPGATVTARVGSVECSAVVDSTGSWFCLLPAGLASGVYSLTASQAAPWSPQSSSSSSPVSLTIDIDAPAPPGVTLPAGTPVPLSGGVFSGDGEDGATVTVFAGPHSLCQAVVAGGRWSCTAGAVEQGDYEVSAIQQDVAGNISKESAARTVAFGAPPAPPATATPSPAPGTSPAAGPSPASDVPRSNGASPGSPAQPSAKASGTSPATSTTQGGWSAATRFSAAMQPAFGQAGGVNWALALGIGLAMVALLAVPARLLAGTIRGLRPGSNSEIRGSRLTGRNRGRAPEFEEAPVIPGGHRITAAVALLASATVTVLSAPVDDQPAYLRLLAATLIAVLCVNAVAVVVPRQLSRLILDETPTIAFRPAYLLVSVAATVLSRSLDLEPALVFGLVAGVGLAAESTRRARGRLAAIQVASLTVVGVTAWLLSGSIPTALDPVGAFTAEFVNMVALGSLGAAAVLLLPIGTLPGRRILHWHAFAWLGFATGVFTVLGGLLATSLSGLGGGAGIILIAILCFGFAAASVATWLWVRFVRAPHDSAQRTRAEATQ
jgi:hypothetical protein